MLQDVLHMQSTVLNEELPYPAGTCPIKPRPASPTAAQWVKSQCRCVSPVLTSVMAKASNHTTVYLDDVVCATWDNDTILVGRVFLLRSVGSAVLAAVRSWPRTLHHNMYSTAGPEYLVQLHDIKDVCICRANNGVAFVAPPRGAAT